MKKTPFRNVECENMERINTQSQVQENTVKVDDGRNRDE